MGWTALGRDSALRSVLLLLHTGAVVVFGFFVVVRSLVVLVVGEVGGGLEVPLAVEL